MAQPPKKKFIKKLKLKFYSIPSSKYKKYRKTAEIKKPPNRCLKVFKFSS